MQGDDQREAKEREAALQGMKNSFQIKQGAYSPPCPNCGYCPHCGRSNDPTPYYILPYRPFWYATPTATTAAPLNTNDTPCSKANSVNMEPKIIGQLPISFTDFLGASAN